MERLPAGTPTVESRQCLAQIQIVPQTVCNSDAAVASSSPTAEDPIVSPVDPQDPNKEMSYQSYKNWEFEDDQTDHSSMSMTGIIRLQSDRRKGNRSWRPMQASDLGDLGDVSGDGSSASSHFDIPARASTVSESTNLFGGHRADNATSSYASSNQNTLNVAHDKARAIENSAMLPQANSEDSRQHEGRYLDDAIRARTFGVLPDPIRLSEQTGKFDGQVVFIGHPNRDISAHQWSSSSFQWVNIGRYCNARGKLEGSLASDRLRGTDEPHDTLEYFRLAAENRQAMVVENGRPEQHATVPERVFKLTTDIVASSQTYSSAPALNFHTSAQIHEGKHLSMLRTAPSVHAKNALEDPFVTASNVFISQSPSGKLTKNDWLGSTGSLDLTYKFPTQATVASQNIADPVRDQYESRQIRTSASANAECSTHTVLSGPTLQEVAFGEEAATQCGTVPVNNGKFLTLPSDVASQRSHTRLQQQGRIEEILSTLAKYDNTISSAGRVTNARVAQYAAPPRPIAPLIYTKSALNATAMPFAKATTAAIASGPKVSTVNATAAGLHYSDPDSLRTNQRYEVVNGLNQQAPTPQSFKGPFFTESKPTTNDPTVALSVRVNEEEELANWFRDGHRPARQKEYAKSLIAAAEASDKIRHLGAVGEAYAKQESGPYANTVAFVRLYENLSEYAEERRNGSGQSYFTRRWKPAVPQVQCVVHDKGASYLNKGSSYARWSKSPGFRPS